MAKYRERADAPSEQIAVMKKLPADGEADYYHVDSFYLEAIITKAIQEFHQEFEQSRERISLMEQEDRKLREQIAGMGILKLSDFSLFCDANGRFLPFPF